MSIGKDHFTLFKREGRWVSENNKPVQVRLNIDLETWIRAKGEVEIFLKTGSIVFGFTYRFLINAETNDIISIKRWTPLMDGYMSSGKLYADIDKVDIKYNSIIGEMIYEKTEAVATDVTGDNYPEYSVALEMTQDSSNVVSGSFEPVSARY